MYGLSFVMNVLHGHLTVHPHVNIEVQTAASGEASDADLQGIPITIVKGLPLRRGIQVPKG